MGLIFSHNSTASISSADLQTKNQFEHDHQTSITENGSDKHYIELVVNMADVKIIDEKLTDYEKKIIRFSYKFIKDDLSQFGVITFMKYDITNLFFLNRFFTKRYILSKEFRDYSRHTRQVR